MKSPPKLPNASSILTFVIRLTTSKVSSYSSVLPVVVKRLTGPPRIETKPESGNTTLNLTFLATLASNFNAKRYVPISSASKSWNI